MDTTVARCGNCLWMKDRVIGFDPYCINKHSPKFSRRVSVAEWCAKWEPATARAAEPPKEHLTSAYPTWSYIKSQGSGYYKGIVEQIDLFKADGTLQDWALNEIRAHAARNIAKLDTLGTEKAESDMKKIIHYANMILCLIGEKKARPVNNEKEPE